MLDNLFLLFGLGTTEIVLIVLAVLLLFGGRKIPELMKGLGKGIKQFKDGMHGLDDDLKDTPRKDPSSEKKTPPPDPAG
jgi:sec-independent protein translocase protein TatA